MTRCIKATLITAVILIIIGVALFLGALASMDFELSKLNTQKYQTNSFIFDDDFEDISICVDKASVILMPSDNNRCEVKCFEEERLWHSVKVQDGTLIIDTVDQRKWYDYIGFSFQTPEITVSLPKEAYNSLFATTKTGKIEISDEYSFETVKITGITSNIDYHASASESMEISTTTGKIVVSAPKAGIIRLSASTGSITLHDTVCKSLDINNTTGHVKLMNTVADERITIKNSTGGVRFERCDAADINIQTTTGNVEGTLISEKIFVSDTSTGKISVPNSESGGRCKIKTTTGNINIEIE